MSRFPFPIPFGWYQVGWPSDVEIGDTKPLYYFGRDLVLWRGNDGEVHLQDAICPHLGGHLGHGGHVENCEIQCPFHGWKFDGEGKNSEIPYSERINQAATIRNYPLIVRNGVIWAWYHPFDEEPMWEIPEVPEFNDSENFSELVGREFDIEAAWQEIAENQVDSAHFRYVHNTEEIPEVDVYDTDGPHGWMRSRQKFVTPQGVTDGTIDVDQWGPGFGLIRFGGIVDTVLMGCNTPVDEENCHVRFSFTVRKFDDEATTSTVSDAFVDEVSQQIVEDLPIWRYKAHIVKPALADTDGPYIKFRKWAEQFYAEDFVKDQDVYPPNPPSTHSPEAEGVTKETASSRLKGEDVHRADMMSS